MTETHTTPCTGCGAPILWALTQSGKHVPLDPVPRPDGNIILMAVDGRAVYVRKDMLVTPMDDRYVSHFATCPVANQFRRKR